MANRVVVAGEAARVRLREEVQVDDRQTQN